MRITVTAQDITEGSTDNASYCPIAKAINRAMGWSESSERVSVTRRVVRIYQDRAIPDWIERVLPDQAKLFVRSFDEMEDVGPFNFQLDI